MKKARSGGEVKSRGTIIFQPLRKRNWDKFVDLFGENGACAQCWCMFYRLSRSDFRNGQAKKLNKNRMKKIVWSGKPTGLLALLNGRAIAWLALAPRSDLYKLANSRAHKRIDNEPVWSITCFFVRPEFRGTGVSRAILKGAVKHARKSGTTILEAYPVDLGSRKWPDSDLWHGVLDVFVSEGFRIVERRSRIRPTVRRVLSSRAAGLPNRNRSSGKSRIKL